ncbi:hypothetical protein C5167_012201 [Papaver somniferum]|uniref:Cohesin subunit SA-3 n=1 Tax=Papaver somniferum TaxID=3469 RepID=A0A4Y7J0Q3_PAPSO|nr:sister-chromatid cohesion protein 3-like [Papaver somniferum]RZC53339.1 hypothetical protein C5167_012201 [Papaver somniferum]
MAEIATTSTDTSSLRPSRKKKSKVSVESDDVSIGEKHDENNSGPTPTEEETPVGSDDIGSNDDFEEIGPSNKRKRIPKVPANLKNVDLSLIDTIKGNGKQIPHVVKNWVEQYEKSPKSAMVELLMMLFEVCGAKYSLIEKDLDDTEVDNVVVSLVELAQKGEVEDYHSSKRKEFKNFKENLLSFWDNLVIECQNGPLLDEVLFEKCMDYVIALSCSPPRVFRQVASLIGLQLVTSFITVAKMLGSQRETTQRQLTTEVKKRKEGPRVDSLGKRLEMTQEKINVIENMMRKLFKGLFVHRYRDVDPNIRMSSIQSLGVWVLSYPSMFLQDLYLKYLGWTLNDKNAGVRKCSILALQNLYEVDDNVPSLGLFTERFSNRMIELADDIDVSVSVCAIGLLKQLLRHQLLSDEDLGPLYDLLIDEPPEIRRAIGALVNDHLIAQKFSTSKGDENDSSDVHLGRLLQILREFTADPILITYVIDDVWDYMKAMKDWKFIVSMLLDEKPGKDFTDVDATNLVRLLHSSSKKAVGERIVPATDNRKQYYNKAQKEALENNRRDITLAMMNNYPKLLPKFMADKDKVSPLVEIILNMNLELYSLKRQEQNFEKVLRFIKEAFFKHGEKEPLRSCVKAMSFCSTESQGDLQDCAHTKLKELEDELITKLKSAMKQVEGGDDDYSFLVNLKRVYELQLAKCVPIEILFEDFVRILEGNRNMDEEVVCFLLLNMYMHVTWCLRSIIDEESISQKSLDSLLSKRTTLFKQLEYFLNTHSEAGRDGRYGRQLACRVCGILAEMWFMFRKSNFASSKLEGLGFCPDVPMVQKFWSLCEQQLNKDEIEDDEANQEYIEETNKEAIMIAASKLVASDAVPKDYLAPETISHFLMHGPNVGEIVKQLISVLKKTADRDVCNIFLESLKRAYNRHVLEVSKSDDESLTSKSLTECKDLAARLAETFVGAARNKYRSDILKIVKEGILFAFEDAPRQLSFLEAILHFVYRLPTSDILEIVKDVQKRTENVNTDEDPSGWRPYVTFVDHLREKYAKNAGLNDDKEGSVAGRRGRSRKRRNIQGKKLFDEQESSEEDDYISASDQEGPEEEDQDEEDAPLIHSFKSAAKLRSLRVQRQESKSKDSGKAPQEDASDSRMSGSSE